VARWPSILPCAIRSGARGRGCQRLRPGATLGRGGEAPSCHRMVTQSSGAVVRLGAGPEPAHFRMGCAHPGADSDPLASIEGSSFSTTNRSEPRPVFAFSLRNLGRCCAPRDSRLGLSGDPSSVVVATSSAVCDAALIRMSGLTDRCRLSGGRADRREPVMTATAGPAAPLLPDTPRGRATAAFGVNHCTEFARGQAGQGSAPRLLRTGWLVRLRRRPQRPEQLAHRRRRRPSGYLVPVPGGIVSVCTARRVRGHPDCRAAPRRVAMRVAERRLIRRNRTREIERIARWQEAIGRAA
jgi:hypothetical protein